MIVVLRSGKADGHLSHCDRTTAQFQQERLFHRYQSVQGMSQNLNFGDLSLTLFGEFRRLTPAVKDDRTPVAGGPTQVRPMTGMHRRAPSNSPREERRGRGQADQNF